MPILIDIFHGFKNVYSLSMSCIAHVAENIIL